jgi:perosamine synthetase
LLSKSGNGNKWELAFDQGTIYGVEELAAIMKALNEGAATTSYQVREFERQFATYVGAGHGVAANSWGGAAHLLAILMDFQPGDEVIVPAMTFQAAANIFIREGAKVVFADVDPRTFTIDPQNVKDKITSKTKAVIAAHMCGQPCDLDPISAIANQSGIMVIQDAAHAPGAEYNGKKLGELGDFVIYSFQQDKNLSTLGEGGMVVTNNKEWAENMRKLRGHGRGQFIGISSRMTDTQAAVGIVQLTKLERHNRIRRELAYYLNKQLAGIDGLVTPFERPGVKHSYHLYNILVEPRSLGKSRDDLLRLLWEKRAILVARHYYPALNCLAAYKNLGYGEGECPVAEDLASRVLTLPLSPRFIETDMDELAGGIKEVI